MMVAAVLGIILYVLGIPVGLFTVLYRMRQQNKLKDPDVLVLLGFLYTDYEPGFW